MTATAGGEQCRSCQAPVMWLRHYTTDKPAPIDLEPVPDGNVLTHDGMYYETLSKAKRENAVANGFPLHKNHFATCPQSKAWRDRKAAGS